MYEFEPDEPEYRPLQAPSFDALATWLLNTLDTHPSLTLAELKTLAESGYEAASEGSQVEASLYWLGKMIERREVTVDLDETPQPDDIPF